MLTFEQCDERTPRCIHCVRREESCEWRGGKHGDGLGIDMAPPKHKTPVARPSIPPTGDSSVVNLLHMKLFHHFETHTRHTLAFDTVWPEAMKMSVGCEYLMHAILCLSANHLAFLRPEDAQYDMAAATHLSQMLRLFQEDLTRTSTVSNIDRRLAAVTLLSYIVWSEMDVNPSGAESLITSDAIHDRVFSFGAGTFGVFMSANLVAVDDGSIFVPHAKYSPRAALCNFIGLTSATIDSYQSFFDYNRPVTVDRLSVPNYFDQPDIGTREEQDLTPYFHIPTEARDIVEAYTRVIPRLCVMLALLPEMASPGNEKAYEDIMPDLARYVFTFPVVCFRESERLSRRQGPKWWLILYHFYRAARIALPSRFWWAQQRCRFMEPLLREMLISACKRNEE